MSVLYIVAITLLINLPLGIWRSRNKKFSIQWFIAIHAAIPLIYYLRASNDISIYYVPLMVATTVIGQLLGGLLFPNSQQSTK